MYSSLVCSLFSTLISACLPFIVRNLINQINRSIGLYMNRSLLLRIVRHFSLISLTTQNRISHRFKTIQLLYKNTLIVNFFMLYFSRRFTNQILLLLLLASSSTGCTLQLVVSEMVRRFALTERSGQWSFTQLAIDYFVDDVFETRVEICFPIASGFNCCWFADSLSQSLAECISLIPRIWSFLLGFHLFKELGLHKPFRSFVF